MDFKLKKSETLFKGQMLDLKVDTIEYKSGNAGVRELVIHPGGAAIIPVTNEGKIILVSQYRYPFQKVLIELPAGKLDGGEDPSICAQRELEEETGYKSDSIEKLGIVHTSPGYCTEILHLFIAKNLIPGDHKREEGEDGMEIYEYTFDEIDLKIQRGEITDAKTICGIYMAKKALSEN